MPNAQQTAKQSGEFITFTRWLVKPVSMVRNRLATRIGEQDGNMPQHFCGVTTKKVTLEQKDLRRGP